MLGEANLSADVARRCRTRDSLMGRHMLLEEGISLDRFVRIPYENLEEKPDTFNLIGPEYRFAFVLADELVVPQQDSTRTKAEIQD